MPRLRSSSRICATVPATSAVSVLVIDCTTIGAPPPTATLPTMTCVVLCRVLGPATSFRGGFTGWFMGSQISGFGDIHQGDGGRACLLYWNCTGGPSRSSRNIDRRVAPDKTFLRPFNSLSRPHRPKARLLQRNGPGRADRYIGRKFPN